MYHISRNTLSSRRNYFPAPDVKYDPLSACVEIRESAGKNLSPSRRISTHVHIHTRVPYQSPLYVSGISPVRIFTANARHTEERRKKDQKLGEKRKTERWDLLLRVELARGQTNRVYSNDTHTSVSNDVRYSSSGIARQKERQRKK